MLFRKKPVVIEAVQFTGNSVENFNEVEEFVGGDIGKDANGEMVIATLEGALHVSPGDWIIRGVKGEFYPCKPDIFAATYELASNASGGAAAPQSELSGAGSSGEKERGG